MPRVKNRVKAGQRGVVLYIVLVVVLLLLASGAILGIHLQRRMAIFRDQERNLHVQALLDAGMAEAMAVMRQDFTYQGRKSLNLDGGSVVMNISYSGTTGIRTVATTSKYRGESRHAIARVRVENGEPPIVESWKPVAAWEKN